MRKTENMIQIKILTFNPFQTNTYVLWDETKEAIIIDSSFSTEQEYETFKSFVDAESLHIKGVYNTHCHFDHCFGAAFLKKHLKLSYAAHKDGIQFTENAALQASIYGLQIDHIEAPTKFIDEGDLIKFGKSELRILNTPGHADGSLCFVSDEDHFVITGDVLFKESIGRTDLPTGNLDLLLASIHEKLFKLPGDFTVYPGHGPKTVLAQEQSQNPFLHFGEVF